MHSETTTTTTTTTGARKPSKPAAPKAATAAATTAKRKPAAPKAAPKADTHAHCDESTRTNPVDFVWAYAAKHHAKLGRAECVRALEKLGIATHTARTQYQRAHAAGYPNDREAWLSKFTFAPSGKPVKRSAKKAKA